MGCVPHFRHLATGTALGPFMAGGGFREGCPRRRLACLGLSHPGPLGLVGTGTFVLFAFFVAES